MVDEKLNKKIRNVTICRPHWGKAIVANTSTSRTVEHLTAILFAVPIGTNIHNHNHVCSIMNMSNTHII